MCIKGLGLQWMAVVWWWLGLMDFNTKSRKNKVTATCTPQRSSCLKMCNFFLTLSGSNYELNAFNPAPKDLPFCWVWFQFCIYVLQKYYALCNHLSYGCAPAIFKVKYALWSLNIYRQHGYVQHPVLSHQRLLQDRSVLYDVKLRTSSWSFDKHQECVCWWISSLLDTKNNFGSRGDDTYGLFDSFRQRDVKQRTK